MRFSFFRCIAFAWLANSGLASVAVADGDDYSRQQLFASMIVGENRQAQYALAPNFKFPDSVRVGSTFGIDVSHFTYDGCKCSLDWKAIGASGVHFVYAKATQGSSYVDPTVILTDKQILEDAPQIEFGAYHFMTAGVPAGLQANFFLKQLSLLKHATLQPSLDLEWNSGPISNDCPQNAVISIVKSDGAVSKSCDQWFKLSGSQIVDMVNLWIDTVKAATGKDVLLYTNASWWRSRVGKAAELSDIHTKLFWIADYSKSGLATEIPLTPDHGAWYYWQFSDKGAVSSSGQQIFVDVSIRN